MKMMTDPIEEPQLYGRKRETEYLEKILLSVFKENEVRTSFGTASSTTDDGIIHGRFNCQMVLVRGPEGSGKRTFVRSVLRRNLKQRACSLPLNGSPPFLLASGRFRPYRVYEYTDDSSDKKASLVDERPFSAFDEAIQEVTNMVVKDEALMSIVRDRVQLLLKGPDDMEILTKAFPSMKRWFQFVSSPNTSETSPPLKQSPDHSKTSCLAKAPVLRPVLLGSHLLAQQSQIRCPVLIQFLQAVVSCIPLVLLLEDLEYADEASLALVEALMNKNGSIIEQDLHSKGLLIVATSRVENNMLSLDGRMAFLQRWEVKFDLSDAASMPSENVLSYRDEAKECVPIKGSISKLCFHQMQFSDLTWEDVFEWVNDCGGVVQQCSEHQKREITDLAFYHSDGSPLRIRYCLLFLEQDERILQEVIRKKRFPDLSDLYSSILSHQDTVIQNVVRAAAAIAQSGEGDVDRHILEIAVEANAPCIDSLVAAHEFGLFEFDLSRDVVRFSRNELQKIAYNAIPFSNLASFHLDIGRRIWTRALEDQDSKAANDEENIGMVLLATLQLRNCINLLVDFEERLFMAQQCYDAGQKASSSGDFYSASKLFEFATCILGSALWRPDLYETSLVLHNALAQAYCSIGDFTNMAATVDLIFDHATCFRDKLSAYIILVYSTGTRLKVIEAFRIACMALRELGEPVNQNPSTLNFVVDLLRTKAVLRGKSDEFLANLRIAEDPDYLIVTQLLSFAMIHSCVVYPKASFLISYRLLRLSLKNGITGPSAVAFVAFGFSLCASGSFEEGYRYGLLAIKLVDKFEVWRPRVHMLMYGYVTHWVRPFRDCFEPLQLAQYSAFMCGDLEVYSGSTSFYILVQLNSGSPLQILEPCARSFCCSMDLFGQKNALLFALPIWEFICDLSGNKNPLDSTCEIKDAATALKYSVKEGNKFVVGNFYMLRTMWFFLIGDYSKATQMAKKTSEYRQVNDYTLTFYEALASLSMVMISNRIIRRKYLNRGRTLSRKMKSWAQRCPENFLNKFLLLEAELAALNGNSEQAIEKFSQSIDKAKEEAFWHEEAIAYERFGLFHLNCGDIYNALICFEKASATFELWGATTLVTRINNLITALKNQKS